MKRTKISSLFPKRGNRNAKRTENYIHKNKITHGDGGEPLLRPANFTFGPDATLNTEIHEKNRFT